MNETVVVIPAFEPDEQLLSLLKELKESMQALLLVVNDGSGSAYENIFEEAKKYAHVISYAKNQGKGEALKHAFQYILYHCESVTTIITADADGQHKVSDICKVCEEAKKNQDKMILGSRRFVGKVPIRSRFGNFCTQWVFTKVSKVKILDTQTGLRAFPKKMVDEFIQIQGSRYEYEMNVLLYCAGHKIQIDEVPIDTVYLNDNKSSHFHVFRDSIAIYRQLLQSQKKSH